MNGEGTVARKVPRKRTFAGGFVVDLGKFPEKPSGRSGEALVAPEVADANFEAHQILFALQRAFVTVGEELHCKRACVADELLRGALLRVADLRKYVQVLVQADAEPHVCVRCKTEPTDDPKGARMCAGCVVVAYGGAVPR